LYSSGKIVVGDNFSVDASGHLNATDGEFSGTLTGVDIYGGKYYNSEGGAYLEVGYSGTNAGDLIM
jgi:hypothetical protein